jgi:hypothetical protein
MLTDKPVWRGKEESEKAYAFITGTVNLTCEVTAEPAPKFEWLKANEALTPQQKVTIFEEEFCTILQVTSLHSCMTQEVLNFRFTTVLTFVIMGMGSEKPQWIPNTATVLSCKLIQNFK